MRRLAVTKFYFVIRLRILPSKFADFGLSPRKLSRLLYEWQTSLLCVWKVGRVYRFGEASLECATFNTFCARNVHLLSMWTLHNTLKKFPLTLLYCSAKVAHLHNYYNKIVINRFSKHRTDINCCIFRINNLLN